MKYKLEIRNYDTNNNPVSGVSRIINGLTFNKLRSFQNKYPGRDDLRRKLNIRLIND
jgi:hypothetical protein